MLRTAVRAGIVAAALAGLSIAAGAGSAAAAPAATSVASIRAAHFAPGTPGVDVYLTSFSGGATQLWHGDETYGSVSPYEAVPTGQYVVAMRLAGAPPSSVPMLSVTVQAKAGAAYTLAAIGAQAHVSGVVLNDDLTPPTAGHGRVRLIQAASNAPKADVVAVGGPVLASNAVFGTSTGYAQIPAGTWPLEARAVDANPAVTTGSVSVPAGSVTSIVLLNGPGSTLALHTVLDAAAATSAPAGPIDAGGGGTAPNAPTADSSFTWPLAGVGVFTLAGLSMLARRRRA